MNYSIFRAMKVAEEEDVSPIEEAAEKAAEEKTKLRFSRGEIAGSFMALFVFIYSLSVDDLPVVFMAAAFLLFMVKKVVAVYGGHYGKTCSNVLQGFSIAMFLGAVVMAFI